MSQPFQDPIASPSPYSTTYNTPTDTPNIALTFLCGCAGGVANILSSHPLDTVKVRMQLLDMKLSNCFKYMIEGEGLSSLYKGVTSPLFNIPLIYALYFGSYETSKSIIQFDDNRTDTSVTRSMIAGGIAGLAVCGIMTPVELVKCRMQMEGTGKKTKIITAMGMARQVIATQGVKELYKGNLITILREIPAGAVYFGTYEVAKRKLDSMLGQNQFVPLIAGGLAGLLSWVVSYPQDIVKTKLQCDVKRKYTQSKRVRDGGIISCMNEVWKRNGVRGFSKGFSACSMKAVIAESATFFVYEKMKKQTKHCRLCWIKVKQ